MLPRLGIVHVVGVVGRCVKDGRVELIRTFGIGRARPDDGAHVTPLAQAAVVGDAVLEHDPHVLLVIEDGRPASPCRVVALSPQSSPPHAGSQWHRPTRPRSASHTPFSWQSMSCSQLLVARSKTAELCEMSSSMPATQARSCREAKMPSSASLGRAPQV
eukprot:scaffold52748_cov60-Phaeocystis_antarctica.AAC.4